MGHPWNQPHPHSRSSRCAHCGASIYTDRIGNWRHHDSALICCDDSERTQAEP